MKQVLLVFIGGGFGSIVRYVFSKWLNTVENALPYGTLVANILGSLLIGFILGYLAKNSNFSQNYTLLLATGFCGGFTTFSAFAFENHIFLKNGDYLNFFFYSFSTLILGLLAVFIGFYFSKVL